MSGTANVPTLFAAAVTATGQQLDNNFSTVVAYLNDPTNRNNFAVSSGTGTYVVSISPAPGGYTAGLEITFQAGNTNTAAVALNVNGLGVVSMLNQDSSALTVSQIIAGGVYKAVHNGTNFSFQQSGLIAASTNDFLTVSANVTNKYISPALLKFSQFSVNAWASFSGTATGTIVTGVSNGAETQGMSMALRVSKTGTGTYIIAFVGAMSGGSLLYTQYPVICTGEPTSTLGVSFSVSGKQTTSFTLVSTNSTNGLAANPAVINMMVLGLNFVSN